MFNRQSILSLRVHGNGFIQMDLGQYVRLHVWHPEVPRQKTSTPIHDHTFGFTSRVIVGSLFEREYSIVPEKVAALVESVQSFRVFNAVRNDREDTRLVDTACNVSVLPTDTRIISCGQIRRLEQGVLHSVSAGEKAATIMMRGTMVPGMQPRVLCPFEYEPDNQFNRYAFDRERLYQLVIDVLFEGR